MPRRVDHDERRQQIADALLRVVARDGLDAVSLRHVATEAEVTAGMVQHYFPSKDAMMQHAMGVAAARYEHRIGEELSTLGAEPDPIDVVRVLVGSFIPESAEESADARIGIAFQNYAAHHPAEAEMLAQGDRMLAAHIADLLQSAGTGSEESELAAITLIALGEGLALATLSKGLSPQTARRALDQHLASLVGASGRG